MTDLNITLTIKAPEAEALIDLLKQCFADDLQKRDDGAAAPAAKPEAPAATAAPTAPAPEANDGAAIASEDTAAEPTAAPAPEKQDGAAISHEEAPLDLEGFQKQINALIIDNDLAGKSELAAIGRACNEHFGVAKAGKVAPEKRRDYVAFMASQIARMGGAANA